LIWIIVGSGLDSIKRVADEISHRAPTHLNPVDIKAIPKEIQPLIDELNRLFSELHEAFEREKRFAADAAHELKTPLAALRAQTQVAMRAHSDGQRLEALQKLITGVDRSAHVVQQLLTMSRMVPEATLPDFSQVNLRKIAAEVIAEIAPKALEKNTEIELVIPKFKPLIKGSPMALNILIRNLIDNAVRYTPYGSKIQVSLLSYRNKTQLIVADDGPGIPEELRQRVFERFFRVIGNRAQGSGLGLGIVKQIADLHHATVQLDVPEWGKGLEVVISFPS
ncbi:MAG TPA: ATP-binding protein, partial [Gammaproteobacteria bacterium]|nr:ATP-binding protein [Gammaproteobacteria bacterium]